MKKIKSLEILLSFGAILIFIAGLSLIFTSDINTIYQVIGVLVLAVFMFGYSFFSGLFLKVENTSRFTFVISMISFLLAYVFAGCNELFGSWFYMLGDGVSVFNASCFGLSSVLTVLIAIRFKNSNWVHLTLLSIIGVVFNLFMHFNINFQIFLIVLGCILVILNIVKINKLLYDFSNVAIFIYALVSILFGYNYNLAYALIILCINVIGILSLLNKYKSFESEVLSIIILGFTCGSFIHNILNFGANINIVLVATSFVLALLDMAASSFNVFDHKFTKIAYKIVISVCFFSIFALDTTYASKIIGGLFMFVSSLTQSYILKNRNYEEFLFPIKGMYFINLVLANIPGIEISEIVINVITVLFILMLYKLSKYDIYKIENMILLVLGLIGTVCSIDTNQLIPYIAVIITLLISFILVADLNKSDVKSKLFGAFILILSYISTNTIFVPIQNTVVLLIEAVFLVLFMVVAKKDKFNFIFASLLLGLCITDLVNLAITNEDLSFVINMTLLLCVTFIDGFMMFDYDSKGIDVFTSVISILLILFGILEVSSLVSNLYLVILGVIFILINVGLKNFKVLGYVGFATSVVNIIFLLRYLEGLSTAAYTLIIGIIILLVVSVIVYKYNKRQANVIKCPKCGSEVNKNESFCGNCGNKLTVEK